MGPVEVLDQEKGYREVVAELGQDRGQRTKASGRRSNGYHTEGRLRALRAIGRGGLLRHVEVRLPERLMAGWTLARAADDAS